MARKRRIQLTAEKRHESEIYKRKLRSCKQELSSSTGLVDTTTAIGEQQKQNSCAEKKKRSDKQELPSSSNSGSTDTTADIGEQQKQKSGRKERSDKHELPSTSSSSLGDTATTGESLPSDPIAAVAAIDVPQQHELVARRIFQRPPPLQLAEDEKRKYTFQSPYPQRFSIPENIVYYIIRNATSYLRQRNLLKMCKSIFRMSQIIPVWYAEETSNSDIGIYGSGNSYMKANYESLQKQSYKFQIYGRILIANKSNPYLASALVQRIHRCSLERLLINNQILTFGEIQLLGNGNKIIKFTFTNTIVKNADGSITDFEKVFESLLCFNMFFKFPDEQHGIGKNIATKISEILESKENHHFIYFRNVPQAFDFQIFSRFLKAIFISQKHSFDIFYSNAISSAYKNQLQQFKNEINQIPKIPGRRRAPWISYEGQDDNV